MYEFNRKNVLAALRTGPAWYGVVLWVWRLRLEAGYSKERSNPNV